MAPAMSPWRWKARRVVEAAGWPGVVAAAVLAAALAAWLGVVRPLGAQARDLGADNADLEWRARKSKTAAVRASAPLTTGQQLAEFERGFPSDKEWSTTYLRLWTLAARHGVALRQADFSRSGTEQDALSRYAVVVPASADYPALRAFIGDALREIPNLAIEEMSLKRDDAKSAKLEARLRLVIFLRRGAVHG